MPVFAEYMELEIVIRQITLTFSLSFGIWKSIYISLSIPSGASVTEITVLFSMFVCTVSKYKDASLFAYPGFFAIRFVSCKAEIYADALYRCGHLSFE